MSKMTSPRAKGKKVATFSSSKIKKETDGIKGDYEKEDDVESTLKMMLRQAHEIHKSFSKRFQGTRRSQSVEDLKNQNQEDLPRIFDGKGDSTKENKSSKKILKDPVKLTEVIRPPLRLKMTNKKMRKKSVKDIEIRKPTSASIVVTTSGKKMVSNEKFDKIDKQPEKNSQKDIKILYEKREDENSEKPILSPEEVMTNINKIWDEGDKNLENCSKTDTKFIDVLLAIGQNVLKKDLAKGEGNENPAAKKSSKNFHPPSDVPEGLEKIWRNEAPPEEELKSYRELKSFVNEELIRIWKPYEKIEVEKKSEKPEIDELKPGRIIVKPNPTSYLEKRALFPKTNCTSLIRKLDQEKKTNFEEQKKEIKDSNIVKRLEKAFETLNGINWETDEVARVKDEDFARSILQRIDDHKKVIVGEISKTEERMNEKFGKRKLKTNVDGNKFVEIHFKRSLEEVQSAEGLLLETEKECKEITRKIFDEYRSKKFVNNIKEKCHPQEVQNKLDAMDRKIQNDLKKLGLINFKKPDRIKLQNKGAEKIKECSGWRKKKSQPSRSISRSIGSAGGTEQGLPPISLQDEQTIPGKLVKDAKQVDNRSAFDQRKVLDSVDKAEDTDDISFDQPLDIDGSWDETLEDPGGSSVTPKRSEPMFVDLEELKYRKGDPSFRYFGIKDEDKEKLTIAELEASRRKRELQRILALDKDFSMDEDKEKRSSKKTSSGGKCGGQRKSIIVDHITSGERIDDTEKVLGHASKLVVKEDKEIREKKKLAQSYYKQGMRRVTEPAIPQSQLSDVDIMKRTNRKSEPINIKRSESKDVECQTDTTDTSDDDDLDLYSLDDEPIN